MKKTTKISIYVFLVLNIFLSNFSFSEPPRENNSLLILPSDIKIVEHKNTATGSLEGYSLYIRKKPGVESVMLTETTKDPTGQEPNYAYRAKEFNEINGNEIRMLNGEKLDSPQAKYSLVDSTPEQNDFFSEKECFHIFIPREIVYGYPWSRRGTVQIGKGTFINIRSFEKKYCDYTGKYFDNPYMFDLEIKTKTVVKNNSNPEPKIEESVTVLTDDYNPVAADTFKEISDMMIFSKGPETIVKDIMDSIKAINPKDKADIVFALDATGSMKDDLQKLKEEWVPALIEGLKEFSDVRLGLLFYRDYGDNFNTRDLPVKYFSFTNDFSLFTKNLKAIKINGTEGGDIPEAVYEALFASMEFYDWREDACKKVILIGDAEPHPTPRRSKRYTRDLIETLSFEKSIEINAIITPDEKERRGR